MGALVVGASFVAERLGELDKVGLGLEVAGLHRGEGLSGGLLLGRGSTGSSGLVGGLALVGTEEVESVLVVGGLDELLALAVLWAR